MQYTAFGRRAGLRVSEYALGTANFGTGWGAGAEPDEARRIFDRFAEGGGTLLDSADGYRFGESEELTGECGVMPAQVAVAWVRERAARSVATLVPVIGPRSLAQLDGYLGALGVRLTDEQYTRLTDVGAVPLGVPHEGIAASLDRLQGGATDRITAPAVPVA
ncbi:aldo/keto reductase [Streptomyces sp. NBC_01336]|uniref:aldo/keto reductase n=1 Tax=Streptomyces sp. NBC_01336 TaxID=2903829 RepID=UPI002E129C12|nr:aldo/keto reductase [Streptomyces sp. NBC_01336]